MNLELFLCEQIEISRGKFARLAILPFEPGWAVLNEMATSLLLNATEKTETIKVHGQIYTRLFLTQDSLNRMVNFLRNETGRSFAVCEQEALALLHNLPRAHTPLTSRKYQRPLTELKELWFHLTDTCNQRCAHCLFSEHLGKGRSLSSNVIFETLKEACDLGVKLIVFTGGEPFTYLNFSEMLLAILSKFPINIAVLTNATLVEQHQNALSRLHSHRIHMQVSLDGIPHIHDDLRGKGTFDAAMKGIHLLKQLRIPFSIATTVNSVNLAEMDSLLNLLAEQEILNLHLMWHFPRGKGAQAHVNPLKLDELQTVLIHKILSIIKRAQELNISVDNLDAVSSQIFSPIGTAFATGNGGWESLAIGPDGFIYSTPANVDIDFLKAGHLSNGLKSVWKNSPILKAIRDISWQDIPKLTNDPWHTLLGTGDLDHMIQAPKKDDGFILKPDPYYFIYKTLASWAIAHEVPQSQVLNKDTAGIILRMGDVTSQCPSPYEINFTHCNCLLSLESQDTRQLVAQFYTERAKKPDETIRNPVKLKDEALAFIPEEARLRMYGCGSPVMDAQLTQGEYILDLGCGTGVECFIAAKQVGKDGIVYGLDMLDEMLNVANTAKRQVITHLGYDNIIFLKGDMEKIPLPDESVDVIISNCVINLIHNKRKVFFEIFRVLKPGGRIVISDVVTDTEPEISIRGDHNLSGECIAGAMVQQYLFDVLQKTNFVFLEIIKRFPYRKIQKHWFHSLTFRAFKPIASLNTQQRILYTGPSKALLVARDCIPMATDYLTFTQFPLKPQELEARGIWLLNEDGTVINLSAGASCNCCTPEDKTASCDCTDNIQIQKQTINTTGCLICGAPIKYLQTGSSMTCSICQRVFIADSCCENGHFVCDACHITNPMEIIRKTCLTSKETDMLTLMQKIRNHKLFPMHGPEHHAMVAAIIVTTYGNLKGNKIEEQISTALERGSKVPGGACGYLGVCGAAMGVGIGFSILLEASPLTPASRQRIQGIVSQVLKDISRFEAARCCQRDSYIAFKAAERISLQILPLGLKAQALLVCSQYKKNRECIGKACPLFPAREETR